MIFLPKLGNTSLHGFNVDSLLRYLRCFGVLREESVEASNVTLRFINSLYRIPFRSLNLLIRFASRLRDLFVVLTVGNINHLLLSLC